MTTVTETIYSKDFVKNSWIPKVTDLSGTKITKSVNTADAVTRVDSQNFRKLRQSGNTLPVNAYNRVKIEVPNNQLLLPVQYRARETPKSGGYVEWETYQGAVALDFLDDFQTFRTVNMASRRTFLVNDAKAKLSDHIANVKWQSPVDLAELDKTASMVKQRFIKSVRFFEKFRKVNRTTFRRAYRILSRNGRGRPLSFTSETKKLLGEMNDMYLEFTYGWNPLAMSVKSACAVLDERSKKYIRRKVSGHSFLDGRVSTISNAAYPIQGSGLAAVCEYHKIIDWRYDVWAGGLFKIEYESSLAEKTGWALTEIPATLWELTYCSFLVDYFANVDAVINNLRANFLLLNESTMYLSEKLVLTNSVQIERVRFDPSRKLYFDYLTIGESPSVRNMYFNRSPLTYGDALVELNLNSPNFGQLFNTLSVITKILGVFKEKRVPLY